MKSVITDASGISTVIAVEDDKLITGTVQDCTPVVEETKRLHAEGRHGSSEMRHAAKLPMVLVEKYLNVHNITLQEWFREPKHVKAMLNDPALRDFRIWPGRV